MMPRKPIGELMQDIKKVLSKYKELSIRRISMEVGTMWGSAEKALLLMKSLGVVRERWGNETKRKERLFSLVKK